MEEPHKAVVILLLLLVIPRIVSPEEILVKTVQQWAKKLGSDLWFTGKHVTRRDDLLHKYKQHANLEDRSGAKLVNEIAQEVENMVDLKVSAVRRIMDAAENMAVTHENDKVFKEEKCNVKHWNVKQIAPLGDAPRDECKFNVNLTRNVHFYNELVNTSTSVVHLPSNVYFNVTEILKAIKWSENLDNIFYNNYLLDPSLSWQYFCSSFGFMRQYPASLWKDEQADLYDCRTRSWYVEAATSAKDIIILLDISGSMAGSRQEIARHVVNNILDTLGNNDFVNIFKFSNETHNLVKCFNESLVQATLGNVREMKLKLQNLKNHNISNFTTAFTKAFETLEQVREERVGGMCNQAIMLITDGVPFTYEELFREFNWMEKPLRMPVRVFTYLIGLEVPDVSQIKWIACENQGYYVHLSTFAEVREQVLKYVQVMARPMVLDGTEHPVVWTPVYADIVDPRMTDYEWERRECKEQKDRYELYRHNQERFATREVQDYLFSEKLRRKQDQSTSMVGYQLMTSVSMPVFDRGENVSFTGNLLGVAGIDIPIEDIMKLMMPHQLGVNGYAFIITNNGFVLTHPDLRPVFQHILKPSYNSVDLTEIELMDNDDGPREVIDAMRAFRDAVIHQQTGSVTLNTRYHYDRMTRPGRMRRHYYYKGIKRTPFTLVVSLPDKYGALQVFGMEEIHRSVVEGQGRQQAKQIIKYLDGKYWRVHPDWVYCKYHYETVPGNNFRTPELQLEHFILEAQRQQPHWKWPAKRFFTPPEHHEKMQAMPPDGNPENVDKKAYFCDRRLLLSLLFDAKITENFMQRLPPISTDDQGKDIQDVISTTVSFVSTHSGLTRWHNNPMNPNAEEPPESLQFGYLNNLAIDELWYKRAVEYHFLQPEAFVYSTNSRLVTASHAIFVNKGERRAPAAVVGFQFRMNDLFNRFRDITFKCPPTLSCQRTCTSPELSCFLIDNHGYVVLSSKSPQDTGRFFGEVQGHVMASMVGEGIFRKIKIYDYQGVCFDETHENNAASFIKSPLKLFGALVEWILTRIVWIFAQTNLHALWHSVTGIPENVELFMKFMMINRTRPVPCDREVDLFELAPEISSSRPRPSTYEKPSGPSRQGERGRRPRGINNLNYDPKGCKRPYVAELVEASNLLMVVVDDKCKKEYELEMSVVPNEVDYNMPLACYLQQKLLPRRNLSYCINHHPMENEIRLCGRAGFNTNSKNALILSLLITCLLQFIYKYESH